MRPVFPLILLLIFATSCGNLQNLATKARAKRQQRAMEKLAATSSEEAEARLGANALGEVAYVDDAEQFVLVRTLTGVTLPEEAGLETRRGGKRTALLRSTSERKNAFTAADLLEGTPQTGDGVFPSTAKPKAGSTYSAAVLPPQTTPAPSTAPAPAMDPAAAPTLPREAVPLPPAGDDFDPTDLPALQDPVKTPDDLKR